MGSEILSQANHIANEAFGDDWDNASTYISRLYAQAERCGCNACMRFLKQELSREADRFYKPSYEDEHIRQEIAHYSEVDDWDIPF